MSSFAMLLLAAPASATAEQVIAAHRARTSIARARGVGPCGENEPPIEKEDVLVCGRRDDGRYRVEGTPVGPAPGLGGERSVEAGMGTFSTCGVGANLCGKPAIKLVGVPFGPGKRGATTGVVSQALSILEGSE